MKMFPPSALRILAERITDMSFGRVAYIHQSDTGPCFTGMLKGLHYSTSHFDQAIEMHPIDVPHSPRGFGPLGVGGCFIPFTAVRVRSTMEIR